MVGGGGVPNGELDRLMEGANRLSESGIRSIVGVGYDASIHIRSI